MEQLKYDIVKELHNYLGVNIVPGDTAAPKPSYPYLSYKITTPYGEVNSFSRTNEIVPSAFDEFSYDVLVTRREQPQFTMSATAYSLNESEACALAVKAADWFKFAGYDYLKEDDGIEK